MALHRDLEPPTMKKCPISSIPASSLTFTAPAEKMLRKIKNVGNGPMGGTKYDATLAAVCIADNEVRYKVFRGVTCNREHGAPGRTLSSQQSLDKITISSSAVNAAPLPNSALPLLAHALEWRITTR